jgi:hypothetical protein
MQYKNNGLIKTFAPKPQVQGEMRNIANVYIAKIVAYYENKMKTGFNNSEMQCFASFIIKNEMIETNFEMNKAQCSRRKVLRLYGLCYGTFLQFFGIFGKLQCFHYFLQIAVHYARQVIYGKAYAVLG